MTAGRLESGLIGVSQCVMSLPDAEEMRESSSSEIEGGRGVKSTSTNL